MVVGTWCWFVAQVVGPLLGADHTVTSRPAQALSQNKEGSQLSTNFHNSQDSYLAHRNHGGLSEEVAGVVRRVPDASGWQVSNSAA